MKLFKDKVCVNAKKGWMFILATALVCLWSDLPIWMPDFGKVLLKFAPHSEDGISQKQENKNSKQRHTNTQHAYLYCHLEQFHASFFLIGLTLWATNAHTHTTMLPCSLVDWLWATKTHKHKYKKSTHKQTNTINTHNKPWEEPCPPVPWRTDYEQPFSPRSQWQHALSRNEPGKKVICHDYDIWYIHKYRDISILWRTMFKYINIT